MTTKQKGILQAALELFSKDGIHNTSTLKVARKAKVSEGLIFRHFKNKEGLVVAVSNEVETQINLMFQPILKAEDSKTIIKKTLEIPFIIEKNELNYWRLSFLLNWKPNQEKSKAMQSLNEKLTQAFSDLKYRKPALEATLVIQIIKSTIASIIQDKIQDKKNLQGFLLQKYHF